MNFYKKLIKAGWRVGKKYKKESNRDVRREAAKISESDKIDARTEDLLIRDELAQEYEYRDLLKYCEYDIAIKSKPQKIKPSNKEKEIKKMLSSVRYAVKAAAREKCSVLELNKVNVGGDWTRSYYQSLYQNYVKYRLKLLLCLEDDDISPKLKKQIRELL